MYPLPKQTGIILATLLGASSSLWAVECSPPAALQARLQAHPSTASDVAVGNWFRENRQEDCAIDAFQLALKLEPGAKGALDGLAKSLIDVGDYEAVIHRLGTADRDENLSLDLAIAYRKAGMLEESEKLLTAALKAYPLSDGLTSALVSLDAHGSQFQAALALAEKLARLKPNDFEAQRIYLRTLVVTGSFDTAGPLSVKLLALAPHDADLLNLRGFLERKAGDYAAARKHLEEAIAVNPEDYNARVNLGLVLAQLQDAVGAKEQLEKALALGAAEPQVHFELAKALRKLGETAQAQEQMRIFQQGTKAEADLSLAVLKSTQADEAAKIGDFQKAAGLYREACAAEPDNAGFAYGLAVMLGNLGDHVGERAALEQSIKDDPQFALAQYALGYIEFQANENEAAERQFRLVVKAAPGNAQAWISLAATLGRESRIPEALEAVDHALQLEPNNPAALHLSKDLTQNRP
jgi:tetratricopeptide (TPR) repeat protein